MILSVKSNNKNFKVVKFHSGFNVILAERSSDTLKDNHNSRNGAGKTTLIEIIHFCLGAKITKNSIFKNENLKDWSFILEIEIKGKTFFLERLVNTPNKIFISGDVTALSLNYKLDKDTSRYYVSPSSFTNDMLENFFGLKSNNTTQQIMPSFRELISYIIRRNIDGYRNAFEYYPMQQSSSIQSCNAYFLNLNLQYVSQFQALKEKKKGIENFRNAIKAGVTGEFRLNIGELNSEIIEFESKLNSIKSQLDSFKIHPQYEEISKKANEYTNKIHKLTNTIIIRKQLLKKYKDNISNELIDLSISDIEKIYAEAGIIFKDSLLQPLSSVIDFHKTLISNRKDYLQNEIMLLEKTIKSLQTEIEEISDKRAELMKILETYGALNEYVHIQDRYTETKLLLDNAKKRLLSAEYIEDSKSKLKIENQELLIKSRQDYNERLQLRQHAITLFKENTEYLYTEPGKLTIDLKESGYSFDIDMKNSRSQGVNYMKIFCYDMLLAELGKDKETFPNFLIHDSTIFDGVDERQIYRALKLANEKCNKIGLQYICLLNSDMVPYNEFDDTFTNTFKNNIILSLSDDVETGGLLGIRF